MRHGTQHQEKQADQGIARMSHLWAIHPDWLGKHADFLQMLPNGDAIISPNAVLQSTLNDTPGELLIQDGVAFILVRGILFNGYASWSFATGYKWIQEQMFAALESSEVDTVVMLSTSPGGMVAGAQETAMVIDQVSQVKPVLTFGDGILASAAYWLAAASSMIIITPTTLTGSTGVVVEHIDISGFEEQVGIRTTEITSGELKRVASSFRALTPEGRAYLQGLVSHMGEIFVNDVSLLRGLSEEQQVEISQAGDYVGEQGLTVDLIDSIGSVLDLDQFLALVRSTQSAPLFDPGMMPDLDEGRPEREARMRLQQIVPGAAASGLPSQTNGTGQAAAPEQASQQATADGAAAERLRIATILGNAPDGCEAEAQEMAFINPCSVEEANAVFLKALKQKPKSVTAPAEQATAPVTPPQATETAQSEQSATEPAAVAPQSATEPGTAAPQGQGQATPASAPTAQLHGLSVGLQRFLGEGISPAPASGDTSQKKDPILQAMLDAAHAANELMENARSNSPMGNRRRVRTQNVPRELTRNA